MSLLLIVCYTALVSFIFSTQTSPAILLIILLALAFIITLGLLTISSWIGIILYLVYVGGLLVIFSYFITLNPNNILQLPPAAYYIALIPIYIEIPPVTDHQLVNTGDWTPIVDIYYNLSLFILLGVILLLVLIVVANVASRASGTLRPYH